MKGISLAALCFAFFLLFCSCGHGGETSGSGESSQSSASQPQDSSQGDSSQAPDEGQALSYQEYFSTQRPFEAVEPFCTVFLGKEEEGGGLIPDGLYLREGEQEPRLLAEGVASYSVGETQIYYASGSCHLSAWAGGRRTSGGLGSPGAH